MSSSELYTKGARVWIPDAAVVWKAAQLLEDYMGQKGLRIQYEDETEETTINITEKTLPHLRNPEILIGENDLTSLSYLNEPEVLYNLQVRFMEQNMIYTYCGIVLVAINPYEYLDIYSNDTIQAYSGRDMGTMDPHIFAVSEEAFKQMSRYERNQSIIVSGESGAGKTVSAKFAMRYFAAVGGSQAETQVEKKVLASNPIMEAIGNAKTTRNDNSSRFGKYIEISFSKHHSIVGAHMRTYLLEKSRCHVLKIEEKIDLVSNFHQSGLITREGHTVALKTPESNASDADDFFYTGQGAAPEIQGVDDAEDLKRTMNAFETLGFSQNVQMMIFQILSAILHFGNVRITGKSGETCNIPNGDPAMSLTCKLLGIEESQMRIWLCNRKLQTGSETLIKPLTESQAGLARDALVKTIYSRLFDWIVTHINKTIHTSGKVHKFIGVLDIYGFETFQINSFEQFCINYANEKLQQIFNMHVFKLEQEEYVREQIEWSFIEFHDNQPCIDLIESKLGVLDLLDDECKMPKGSDGNWCQKLYDKHQNKSPHFDKPRMSRTAFIIVHFADRVEYESAGFLEKNRDTVFEEQINTLRASEYELVAVLFTEETEITSRRRGSSQAQPVKAQPRPGNKQNKKTVGSQFRDSLCALMDTLNATEPHYIRCIKPNDVKEAFLFDPNRAVEQLRACGVLETIRISAAGFPSRWTYPEFFQRYRVLAQSKNINKNDMRKTCEVILVALIADTDKYRFGKTKIFFRAGQVAYLEKLRTNKLQACGVMIQKHIRGWLQRFKYQRIRRSVLLVQTFGRGLLARRYATFLKKMRAATVIQAAWKGYHQRKKFNSLHSAIIVLQAHVRALFARKKYVDLLQQHKAVILQKNIRTFVQRQKFMCVMQGIIQMQCHFRRRKARVQLKALKMEAKSVDHIKQVNKGLENKIIELQQRLDEKAKQAVHAKLVETEMLKLKNEVERLKTSEHVAKISSNKIVDLEEELAKLRAELEKMHEEKKDWIQEKEEMKLQHQKMTDSMAQERASLIEELKAAKAAIKHLEDIADENVKEKTEMAHKALVQELESERAYRQKMITEQNSLQQRLKNLQDEMQVIKSRTKAHRHTLSDVSSVSLDSGSSSVDEAEQKEETKEKPVGELDVGLVLKMQTRVKDLEWQKNQLQNKLENREETQSNSSFVPDSPFYTLRMQDLQNENEKLKHDMNKLMRTISEMNSFSVSVKKGKAKTSSEFLAQYEAMSKELQRCQEECRQLRTIHSIAKESYGGIDKLVNEDNELELAYKTQKDLNRLLQFQLDKTEKELDRKEKQWEADVEELKGENERHQKLIQQSLTLAAVAKLEMTVQYEIARLTSENLDLRETIDKQTDEIHKLKKMLKTYAKKLKDGEAAEIRAQLEKDETDVFPASIATVIHKERTYMGMLEYKREDVPVIIQNLILDLKPKLAESLIPCLPAYILFMCVRHTDYIHDEMKVKTLLISTMDGIKTAVKKCGSDLEGITLWLANTCRLLHMLKQYSGDKFVLRLQETMSNIVCAVVECLHQDMMRATANLFQANKMQQFQTANTPQQNEQSLRNFDLSEYSQVFSDLAVTNYHTLIKRMQECMQPKIIPAILEHEAIAGLTASKPSGLRGRSSSIVKGLEDGRDARRSMDTLVELLSNYLRILQLHAVDAEVIKQIFRQLIKSLDYLSMEALETHYSMEVAWLSQTQSYNGGSKTYLPASFINKYLLFYFLSVGTLNNLLLRKDMCNWSKGMQIRYNLTHLEQWLRDNSLLESGALAVLEPAIQASQLLQARKTETDVDSICEMCSRLTSAQIIKIVNIYTPVDEFEERIPTDFIRKIKAKLKQQEQIKPAGGTLLMDSGFIYPVNFPFSPSPVALETITVPDELHLDCLIRH